MLVFKTDFNIIEMQINVFGCHTQALACRS